MIFAKFEIGSDECKSSVPVALIDMHSCSLEAKIKMSLGIELCLTLDDFTLHCLSNLVLT